MKGSTATTVTTPCRILDDDELEGLQWRKDANELKLNMIFGNGTKKFPTAFINNEKKESWSNKDKSKK